jgi:hypothetical protein
MGRYKLREQIDILNFQKKFKLVGERATFVWEMMLKKSSIDLVVKFVSTSQAQTTYWTWIARNYLGLTLSPLKN